MALLILLFIIIAALPVWPYNRNWGNTPIVIIALTILALFGFAFLTPGIGLFELLLILCAVSIVVFLVFGQRGGAARRGIVFCRRCGQRSPASQKHCGNCGHQLP